jgi:hypothetical protein
MLYRYTAFLLSSLLFILRINQRHGHLLFKLDKQRIISVRKENIYIEIDSKWTCRISMKQNFY